MRRVLAALLVAGCASPAPGRAVQAITSGSADPGDPAVIALVDASAEVQCTASAIGPHTAITAAHCLSGRDPRQLRAFFGASVAAGGTFDAISDGRADPAFDPATLEHDVALLTLRDPAPAAPLALDATPLDASLVGTTFQVVGFGATASGPTAQIGTKLAGTAQIAAVDTDEVTVHPDPAQPCNGDSGGPMLLGGAVAGVVSHGDAACSDHAIYARIDAERASFVDPYLAATAPGTASVGDACLYDGQCSDGPCLVTHDDPELAFCSHACEHDADCPAAMQCAADGCRYPEPSPGALGAPCQADSDCTTDVCLAQVCTRACGADATCPARFTCGGPEEGYCFAASGGGCAVGGGGAGALAVLAALAALWALARTRRRDRA